MPWVGFEPTIPVFERTKTVHALNRAATVIGGKTCLVLYKICRPALCLNTCWHSSIHGFINDDINNSGYIASDGRMVGEQWTGRNVEGRGHVLIEALFWHLLGGVEENHESLGQDSRSPGGYLNAKPAKYETCFLPCPPWDSGTNFEKDTFIEMGPVPLIVYPHKRWQTSRNGPTLHASRIHADGVWTPSVIKTCILIPCHGRICLLFVLNICINML
jgi:hypothetical protein